MTWTEQAEELLSAIVETGLTAAAIVAAAWRAGVDPDATDSLTGAALWMHARPKDLLSGGLLPVPTDREMIVQAADVLTDAATHRAHATALSKETQRALEAALRAIDAAERELAQVGHEAKAKAARANAWAQAADCELALEILIGIGTRLNQAIDCLERVPDDLLATYELCYEHMRNGGTFPLPVGFLTGATA